MSACEGPMGPEGPQGLPGTQGPPGPGTRIVLEGQLDERGTGSLSLPPQAGTLGDPPAITCFVAGSTSSLAWLAVSGSSTTGSWGISWNGTNLVVGITGSMPFWYYRVVVIY